jgi:hypothetical protein
MPQYAFEAHEHDYVAFSISQSYESQSKPELRPETFNMEELTEDMGRAMGYRGMCYRRYTNEDTTLETGTRGRKETITIHPRTMGDARFTNVHKFK